MNRRCQSDTWNRLLPRSDIRATDDHDFRKKGKRVAGLSNRRHRSRIAASESAPTRETLPGAANCRRSDSILAPKRRPLAAAPGRHSIGPTPGKDLAARWWPTNPEAALATRLENEGHAGSPRGP